MNTGLSCDITVRGPPVDDAHGYPRLPSTGPRRERGGRADKMLPGQRVLLTSRWSKPSKVCDPGRPLFFMAAFPSRPEITVVSAKNTLTRQLACNMVEEATATGEHLDPPPIDSAKQTQQLHDSIVPPHKTVGTRRSPNEMRRLRRDPVIVLIPAEVLAVINTRLTRTALN